MGQTEEGQKGPDCCCAHTSVMSDLEATAEQRIGRFSFRIAIAATIWAALWATSHFTIGAIWFGAVILSQGVDLLIWRNYRKKLRRAPPSRLEWIILCATCAQVSIVFCIFPVISWWVWGAGGQTFAILWQYCAILHVPMLMHSERRTFISTLTPHVFCLFGLPVSSIIMGAPVDRFGASLILLASVMYLWHIAGSTKKAFERTKSLQLAWEKAQERQAAAEQANKAKSSFLANMSHEIRTPMNGILGMAEALEGGALTDEQRKQISIIRKSGDLLTNVLNDILDLSKIEANRIEIERAPFCLSELADRVQMLYASVAAEKGVSFEIVCEGDCHKRRLGDAHRISQVLHNLVSNAIKFTDEGSVLVRVRAPLEALPDAHVLFEVADTGIGISEEQAENIFEPFAQADSTTTRKYGGSGLGLTIAKGLVEAMGGAMSVRSKMGEGTRFAVELPLPTVKESGREGVKNTKKEAADGLRGLRLLAAEDNAVNREVLALFLRRCAHHVTFVENGLDAVAAFKDGKFDAILMDISMPVMDGQEAMRQVRFLERERGDGAGVPIIAVSAHAMRGQIEECLAAGFDGYVTKPLSFEKLQGELARVLDERSDNADAVSAA